MCGEPTPLSGRLRVNHKTDRLRGTIGLAGAALNADVGIDVTLRLPLRNCPAFTSGDASAAKNAVTVDDVRHKLFSSRHAGARSDDALFLELLHLLRIDPQEPDIDFFVVLAHLGILFLRSPGVLDILYTEPMSFTFPETG